MPDKYEDGKTAMGTQYPSHNWERKYLFITERERKFDFCLKRSKFNNVL